MKTHKEIQQRVENAFNMIDAIEEVKVSPFFKDKAMQRIFAEKEESQVAWTWFTPKLQLATLVGVIVLNVFAFTQMDTTTYDDNVSDFAEAYGLSPSTEENSLFN